MKQFLYHDKALAEKLDREDPLRGYRSKFLIPKRPDGTDAIYLCGNSLGLQSVETRRFLSEYLDDWAKYGVEGHFAGSHPWMPYHEFVTESLARIAGAKPSEVVAMNSLTANLHLLLVSFYRPTETRFKIVIEENAFPSDQYVVASQAKFHGFDPARSIVEVKTGSTTAEIVDLLEREGDSIAVILLGAVNYLTGEAFDTASISKSARKAGVIFGLDLAHAIGNVPVDLHERDIDFAVWCSYKYLNSGPGGIAGLFVHEKHHSADLPKFEGWWGHNKKTRFLMPDRFDPISTAESWQLSNPPIVALASLRASLEIFDEVGIEALRRKSLLLTGYLEKLLDDATIEGLTITSPRDPERRGAQLSLRIDQGRRIHKRLTECGVICDWREPDIIRVPPVPLYNSFEDCRKFVEILSEIGNEE